MLCCGVWYGLSEGRVLYTLNELPSINLVRRGEGGVRSGAPPVTPPPPKNGVKVVSEAHFKSVHGVLVVPRAPG